MNKQTTEMIKLASRYQDATLLNEREGNKTGEAACNGAFWGVIRVAAEAFRPWLSDMEVYDLMLDDEDGILTA